MIVMKFGGTSVGSAEAMRRVGEIVERALPRKPVVVVSAVSKVTDRLLEAARLAQRRAATHEELLEPLKTIHCQLLSELRLSRRLIDTDLSRLGEALRGIYLLRELTPRSLDYVVSFGEVFSSKIVAAHLSARGVNARAWTAWDAGIVTDDEHGEANVLEETYALVKKNLSPELGKRVPVITGFLGRTRSGQRTTLGRGGSDYSAAIIGRGLDAKEIQIWTDVNGIMSCDPRVVADAYTLRNLTFAEAAELAYFGAKVLHPRTVEPAVEVGIPVRIVNTFQPEDPGTVVVKKSQGVTEHVVEGLSVKRGSLLVNVTSMRMLDAEGYLAWLFGVLAKHDVSVDCLATSEVSVSLTVDKRYEPHLKEVLKELRHYARVAVQRGRSIICVVGEGMRVQPGVAGEVFGVMGREGINIELISQGASELNLTFVVADMHADRALCALHDRFLKGQQTQAQSDFRWARSMGLGAGEKALRGSSAREGE
jgi:aspartate kinase